MPTPYELEREKNIARNRRLLDELDLKQAVSHLFLPENGKVKPVKSEKKVTKTVKRESLATDVGPTRQSARLRKTLVDPHESPETKRKRLKEEEERKAKEAEEQLEAEEREREAKRPRHQDLDLIVLGDNLEPTELGELNQRLQTVCQKPQPKLAADYDAFVFENDKDDEIEVKQLKKRLSRLKVVAQAKVTAVRIYSAAYHPEASKDLIFFGDKHGQLCIWDARAPVEEIKDEDGDISALSGAENGKYWQLQLHWPSTATSSISSIKFDPRDSHTVYTSSYDSTIRTLSLGTGTSKEIFSTSSQDILITSMDFAPQGHEMWISDGIGGVTHYDLRQDRNKAKWYGLSDKKIGTVSVNPTRPHYLLTASNSRALRIWDARKLEAMSAAGTSSKVVEPLEFDNEAVTSYCSSDAGHGALRSEWAHDKSVSSAYWDTRGRSVVSTSYDDNIRIWDLNSSSLKSDRPFKSHKQFRKIPHNCQTGKWVSVFKAQWTQNPDVYPHFTIGNMRHSLDIFSCKGELLARLHDKDKIRAVQAVTCSHPSIVERAVSGNAQGRCFLWAPADSE